MLEGLQVEVLREAAADDASGKSSAQKVAAIFLILAAAGIANHQARRYKDVANAVRFAGFHAFDQEIGRVFADRGTTLIHCGQGDAQQVAIGCIAGADHSDIFRNPQARLDYGLNGPGGDGIVITKDTIRRRSEL